MINNLEIINHSQVITKPSIFICFMDFIILTLNIIKKVQKFTFKRKKPETTRQTAHLPLPPLPQICLLAPPPLWAGSSGFSRLLLAVASSKDTGWTGARSSRILGELVLIVGAGCFWEAAMESEENLLNVFLQLLLIGSRFSLVTEIQNWNVFLHVLLFDLLSGLLAPRFSLHDIVLICSSQRKYREY